MSDNKRETIDFTVEIPMEEIVNPLAGDIASISWVKYAGNSATETYNLRIGLSWNSVKGSGGSTVYAKLWLGSSTISVSSNRNCSLTINGSNKTASVNINTGSAPRSLECIYHNVWVGYYGAKSVTISGSIDVNLTYSGTYVGTMSHSRTAALDAVAPPSPTGVVLSGGVFASGSSHTISWNAVSGVSYEVMMSKRDQWGTWSGWQPYQNVGGASSLTISYGYNSNNYRDVQIGVRAVAGGEVTGTVGTGSQMRRGMRVKYSSGTWGYPVVRVMVNGSWVNAYVRVLQTNGTWMFT